MRRPSIYDVYDQKGEYVGDFTMQELSEMTGVTYRECSEKIRNKQKINGYIAERVDSVVPENSTLLIEFDVLSKRIIELAGGKK